jgi:hypothetical protein
VSRRGTSDRPGQFTSSGALADTANPSTIVTGLAPTSARRSATQHDAVQLLGRCMSGALTTSIRTRRSIRRIASIWVESLGRDFEAALDPMAAAVRDCTDEVWESGMWGGPSRGLETNWLGLRVTNPAAPHALVQRHSTLWGVAWHVLECLDYDLTGEFGPRTPPPPFAGIGGWQITSLPAVWTRSEVLGYIDDCRQRVRDTPDGMTDEGGDTATAGSPLPRPATRLDPDGRKRSSSSRTSADGCSRASTRAACRPNRGVRCLGEWARSDQATRGSGLEDPLCSSQEYREWDAMPLPRDPRLMGEARLGGFTRGHGQQRGKAFVVRGRGVRVRFR